MKYEVVIDTNVFIAAARSRRGASYALLQSLPSDKWNMNISSTLLAEYESKLKIEAARQGRSFIVVDQLLDFLASISGRHQIYFLLRPFLRDPGDDFIIELAVAARAQFIVTHNSRDFADAQRYGIGVIKPRDFLRLINEK